MNEQQLADLFSNQLDQLLQGQMPILPPEASDLQELLDFGRQFSQITFQPSPAAQAAFQGQLTTWFGPTLGGPTTILGLPKTLFFTFIAAAILVGTGAGLAVLGVRSIDNFNELSAPEAPVPPTAAPQDIQDSGESEVTEPEGQATPRTPQSSLGETIPAGGTSSLGDTLPPSSTLGETLSLPTPVLTSTAEGDVISGENAVTDDTGDTTGADADSTSTDGEDTQKGDHDKGHGNDADGIDEDNPGNSGDVLGGDGNNQGQDSGLGGLGRGNDNGGGQGGQGGQGSGGGQGGGKGKSNSGGKSKSGK